MKNLQYKKMVNINAGTSGRDCLLAGLTVGLGLVIASGGAWGPGLALAASTLAGNSDCWAE